MKKLILILSGVALMILFTPIYSFSQTSNETGKAKTSITKKTDCTKTCPEAKACNPSAKEKAACKDAKKCDPAKCKDGKACDPAKCPDPKNCNHTNCTCGKSSGSKSGKEKD